MADFGIGNPDRGVLDFVLQGPSQVDVFMRPSENALKALASSSEAPIEPVLVLRFDSDSARAIIFPIDTHLVQERFFKPKYDKLLAISIPYNDEIPTTDDELGQFLDLLPRGFTKDPQFGFGFPRLFRTIVDAVESQTECTHLAFHYGNESSIDGDTFAIPLASFEEARAEIERIEGRSNVASLNVRKAASHNWVASQSGGEVVEYKRGRHPMIKAFADSAANDEKIQDEDIDDLLDVLTSQSDKLQSSRPEALAKLREEIELVELDALISIFEGMLAKHLTEDKWQRFFEANPFILSFAFGYPLILTQGQASVGGRKLSGGGGKIADFLAKNPSTNNVALFEIKTPSATLLTSRPYRGGVFGPSPELAGSVMQVLDQRYMLLEQFTQILRNSRITDLESFAVRLCLIIGTTPHEIDERKSFELFRVNSSDVDIVTFDELLQRVKLLRTFLSRESDNHPAESIPS